MAKKCFYPKNACSFGQPQHTGSTTNVTIEGCKINNTKASGIMASQCSEDGVDHHNLVIKENVIFDNGTNDHEHNIYVQATDSLIENNTIYNSSENGISIRSTGVVRSNVIWNSAKSCIRYFNDHAPGPSDTLIIENNYCQLSDSGLNGSPAISLLQSPLSPTAWLAGNYQIQGNTVVLLTADRYGIEVESAVFDNQNVTVYDNLVVNTRDIEKAISPDYVDYLENNRFSSSLEILDEALIVPDSFQLLEQVSNEPAPSDYSDTPPENTSQSEERSRLPYLVIALLFCVIVIFGYWIAKKKRS